MAIGNITNFPQGFSYGVSLRNVPILQTQPGQVFWLNNSTTLLPNQKGGSDGNRGTILDPFATLSHAISVCTAGRGDIIMVGSGHAESISSSTALNANISGVTIIGTGFGNLRPTFTLNTTTAATITVSANNVSFHNCIFVAGLANIATLFTLTTATDFQLNNCLIKDTSAILNFLNIISTSTTSNANDGLAVTNNDINLLATSGVVNLVAFKGTQDRCSITSNMYNSLTTNAGAIIVISSGKILTNFLAAYNSFNVVNAAGTATAYFIVTNGGTTNTGQIIYNNFHALPTTPLLVTASSGFVYTQNFHADQPDTSGYLLPAADS